MAIARPTSVQLNCAGDFKPSDLDRVQIGGTAVAARFRSR